MLYKENPDRCVYVSGIINDALVTSLVPKINELRVRSNEPITIYIDSPGGDIYAADVIRNLAIAADPNGSTRDLVTVAVGTAASAAADLLAQGDHAIAYDHTLIVYHGTRQDPRKALTSEAAISLASSLRQTNEAYAMRLARRSFRRMLYAISTLAAFPEYQNGNGDSIQKIADELEAKITPPNKCLIHNALDKCNSINKLTEHTLKKLLKIKPSSSYYFDKAIFNSILDYKQRLHKGDNWNFAVGGIDEVVRDFKVFYDFHFGPHTEELESLMDSFGEVLLSVSQHTAFTAFLATAPTDSARIEWLLKECRPKMSTLWYFAVSVARILQTADFVLSAMDAVWLGLVDEVPGSDFIPLRKADDSAASVTKVSVQP